MITSHPLYNSPDSGINLPEVKIKDVENLLKAINNGDFVEIGVTYLKGVQNLAKVLQIELIVGRHLSNLVSIKVIPKLSTKRDEDFDDNIDSLEVSCEQSLIEEESILHINETANNKLVTVKKEPKSPTGNGAEYDDQDSASANVTRNYQGFGVTALGGNSSAKRDKNGTKKPFADTFGFLFNEEIKEQSEKSSFDEDEGSIGYNDDVDNDPDFRFSTNKAKKKVKRGKGRPRKESKDVKELKESVKIEPEESKSPETIPDEIDDIPEGLEIPESTTGEKVCPFCNITCKSWQGLKSHIGLVHRNTDKKQAPQQKHVCKCGKMFTHSSRTLYKEHRQKCAAYRKEAFICEFCKSPFDSMPALNNHKYSVHGIMIKARTCVCGQSFDTGHSFRKHEINCEVYRSAAIFCGECNLPFLTKGHLKQHLQSTGHFHEDNGDLFQDTGNRVVVCKCGKTFSKHSKGLFKEHREECTEFMKEAFICDICNSAFNEMPSLKNHKFRAHGILKEPNSCVCGMTFGSGWSCRKHSITCETYRSAAIFCDECQLPFLTKGHLEQHIRSSAHRSIGDNKWNISLVTKNSNEL
ncbi:zinc finger protein 37-like protein [Leptotrombidium deliense]|uniref:Zinc finger protein 37-like protein n=1 Tax=Leptotrombidium deliense TaxID=299467 RepID=A0A443SHM1_9ACAR|nr:zinc finger protein 37-like protein [Leptotrombidium deliense]